jgi:NADH-quinone oxidoreductase subunit N
MPADINASILAILPVIVLAAWASILLLIDLFFLRKRPGVTSALTALGLLVSLGLVLVRYPQTSSAFGGMITVDRFANFQNLLLLSSGLVGVALAHDYLKRLHLLRGEYYVLLMFSLTGMMLMGMASDLIIVFLGLELLSIPLYVLAGIAIPRPNSAEAALKYFLLGAFSSGFVVYGIALVYGAAASTGFREIIAAVNNGLANPLWLLLGAALILIGLGFKVALVPFHMWVPDAYHGAPTAVTAFMAVGAKAAGFAALLRLFVLVFPSLAQDLMPVFWTLAALTMTLGNVVAIAQSNIKRLLAYSSIAHAGYIIMALVPFGQVGIASEVVGSVLFYLVAYAFTSFAAWAVVIALEQNDETGLNLEDYAGLGRKYPALAAAMAVAMLSFTGIPPTLGFFGKFYLFRTVIQGGFIGLALIGVLTSLVSAYYYLRVVVIMYMRPGEPVVRQNVWLQITALGSAAVVVLLSVFAQPALTWVAQAILQLL